MRTALLPLTLAILGMAGCAPVGSDAWCDNMDEKPKGDWTANEAGDYAKHCIFESSDDNE